MIFESNYRFIGKFAEKINNHHIKNEIMLYNCDYKFAYENGGEITRSFLDSLPEEWKNSNTVFDSRVHMLMGGWYPCIPGYHHDDIARPKIINNGNIQSNGQPDYKNISYKSEHIMGIVNAEVSPTVFTNGNVEVSEISENDIIYRKWNIEIEEMIKNGKISTKAVPDRTLVYFDWQQFHTGSISKDSADRFRWFGRISRNTDRTKRITNEIRTNANVYMEFPEMGW